MDKIITVSNFVGVMKDPPTLESIARAHNVTIESLMAEMEIGLKVEKEHTADEATAGVIVLHHLDENPKYYSDDEFKNARESAWPKSYKTRHLEPGLVRYSDLGEMDTATGKPRGLTLLLTKEAIDRMRPSAKGKPVTNWNHKVVAPEDFKKGNMDGIITGAYWGDDGWEWMEFLAWDESTKENCDKGFQVSCAYVPTDIKIQPGIYHNIPYDGEVLNGVYTHLAIVRDPRYERSLIMCNSLGGTMKKLMLSFMNAITGKQETRELDEKTEVDMDGKKISLETLLNSYKAEQAEQEKKAALENATKEIKDETLIKVDGKEVSVKDLKATHTAMTARLNAAEAEEKAKKDKEKEEADEKAETERKNAEEKAEKEEADKKAETERENEAEKNFKDLQNAKDKGGEVKEPVAYESREAKIARGKAAFGATDTIK